MYNTHILVLGLGYYCIEECKVCKMTKWYSKSNLCPFDMCMLQIRNYFNECLIYNISY